MRNTSRFRQVLACIAALLSFIRLGLAEHWHLNAFEIVVGLGGLVAVAVAVSRKRAANASPEMAASVANGVRVQAAMTAMLALTGILILSIWFAYAGARLFYTDIHSRQLSQDELHWPTTEATIVSHSLQSFERKNASPLWSPVWAYTYSVGDQTYRSQSMALAGGFGANWFASKDDAAFDAKSRADGTAATAYYDPADPSRSVLDRRSISSDGSDGLVLTISALMMLSPVGALALIYVFRRKRRQFLQQSVGRTT